MKFKELLSKGQEALDALKVPFQNALAENNLNAEIIKLEQKISEAELAIQTAKSNKEPKWSTILDALDNKALLERQLAQMKALKEELF